MKRIIIFILMMTTSLLYADFKIMGGVNQSKYNTKDESMKWNYKLGFTAGVGLEKKLTPNILMELDILFFQKGSKSVSVDSPGSKSKYNLNVVSFPILLRTKFLYGTSPYVLAGIEFSYILSHKIKSEGQEDIDLKENTKFFDYGPVFGCGFELELQEHLFLFIEARYHLGLKNIMSNPVEEQSKKTNAVVIVIGARS